MLTRVFSDIILTVGCVVLDKQQKILKINDRTLDLSPSEVNLVSVFMDFYDKKHEKFQAVHAFRLLGLKDADAFRASLDRLREKAGKLVIANEGGFSVFHPFTIYADSLFLNGEDSGQNDTAGYSFNGRLAKAISSDYIVTDEQLDCVRIKINRADPRFLPCFLLAR